MSQKATLSDRQLAFIKEYLIDLNGTQAAIRAGYSENGAGVQANYLLTNPKIVTEIARGLGNRFKDLDINANYVLGTIKQTIQRCSQAVPVLDKQGNETGEWKEDSFAVLKGCELLGKYLKLFVEKVEHSGHLELTDGITAKLSDDELASIEQLVESAQSRSNQG